MKVPYLSLVAITKDDQVGLERTLKSVDAWRAYPGVEQIVVYAGAEPAVKDNDAMIVRQQRSTGIADAFNEGLALARGEWVWFVNGGDAIHESVDPVWLLAHLRRTKADLVVGAVQFDGEAEPRPLPGLRDQWPLIACWLPHQATMIRRELLAAAGGFRSRWRVAMDYDLWLRMIAAKTPVDVLSVVLARFATDGISEAPATVALKWREDAAVIRRHAWTLTRYVLRLNLKLAWRLGRAFVRWW